MRRVLMAFAAAAVCLGAPVSAFAQDVVMTDVPQGAPLVAEMGTADLRGCHLVAQAEYLHFWLPSVSLPPIVTTGSSASPRGPAIGVPGTNVLFGGNNVSYGDTNGGRFGLLLEGDCISYDVSYFTMSQRSFRFSAASDSSGNPVLGVPYNSVIPFANGIFPGPGESAFPVANPAAAGGPLVGSINVASRLEFWGTEANAYWNWRRNDAGRTDLLLGFRYMELNNNFIINAQSNLTNAFGGPINASINDTFDTENKFYGIQVGGKTHQHLWNNLNLDATAKVALGVMHESFDIHGIKTAPGFDPTFSGFFANSGNSGRTSQDEFAAVPQVDLRLSYDVTCWLRVYGGYELMYLSSVALASDQINRNINPSFIPNPVAGPPVGTNSPLRNDRTTDFFAHGLTFGLELSF